MDSKLIAKYLSKGGFKESSIVMDSGRAEKNSAVSELGIKVVLGRLVVQ